MMSTSKLRGKATIGASNLEYTTPAVLGMTSEKIRMVKVKNTEK
jgi:hypothetical protein